MSWALNTLQSMSDGFMQMWYRPQNLHVSNSTMHFKVCFFMISFFVFVFSVHTYQTYQLKIHLDADLPWFHWFYGIDRVKG